MFTSMPVSGSVFESVARICNSYRSSHLPCPGTTNAVRQDSLTSQGHYTNWGAQFLPTSPITQAEPQIPTIFGRFTNIFFLSLILLWYLLGKLSQRWSPSFYVVGGGQKSGSRDVHTAERMKPQVYLSIKIKKNKQTKKSNHIKPSSLH